MMSSNNEQLTTDTLSDIFDEFCDIRDRLEDLISAMRYISSGLQTDLQDLSDIFDDLISRMNDCSCHLLYLEPDPCVMKKSLTSLMTSGRKRYPPAHLKGDEHIGT